VAPDSKDRRPAILPDQAFPAPGILSACRDSGMAARGHYITWGVVNDPTSFRRQSQKEVALVNQIYDTIYFADRDDFDSCCWVWGDSESRQPRWNYDGQYLVPFMQWVYKLQFRGVQSLAFGFSTWIPPMNKQTLNWLQNFPSLKELIIVLGLPSRIPEDRTPTRFTPVTPGTIRAEIAMMMMWWFGECLKAFQVQFPDHSIPQLRVVSHFTSYEGDSSTSVDEEFKELAEQQMRCQENPFGMYVRDE